MTSSAGILVAVDGSPHSMLGTEWAASVATDEVLTFCLVLPRRGSDTALQNELRIQGQEILVHSRARALSANPAVRTQAQLRWGSAAAELLKQSAGNGLVVIGSRGSGHFAPMQLGSTAGQVAAHARCPVVVVRPAKRPYGPVIVGIDDGPPDDLLRFAFETARRTTSELVAIRALEISVDFGTGSPSPERLARMRGEAHTALDTVLAEWIAHYPDVKVSDGTMRDGATRVLIDASRQASMLAVAARGRGGFPELRLGSTCRHVIELAACPVAVVHPEAP
ncbi:MAG TPA: universal stress protein [Mycobacteriales bacterium]|nr:universal stress protein [Mycobacteriales bacterium]